MAQDKRPWERSRQPSGAADLPQTEDVIGVFRYQGADVLNMSDAQVRAFCLERARFFLYEAQVKAADTLGGPDLHLATQYATIAEAFRASSAPAGDQGDGPLENPS